jgi:hypothetical protein
MSNTVSILRTTAKILAGRGSHGLRVLRNPVAPRGSRPFYPAVAPDSPAAESGAHPRPVPHLCRPHHRETA